MTTAGARIRCQQGSVETIWLGTFIYCKAITNSHSLRKGKGRRVSPDSPPTHQWHCDWLEGISISLDSPVMMKVTYVTSGWQVCCRSDTPCVAGWQCGTAQTSQSCLSRKTQHRSLKDRKGKSGCNTLLSPASDQVWWRPWCAKTIARGLIVSMECLMTPSPWTKQAEIQRWSPTGNK